MAANIFTGATNSFFSVATNWSLGTVPTSTDTNTTTFDASSPNCTVNVASNCQSLDFTGYANVLTMSSQLAVTDGTVTFQANQSSRIAGTQSLTLNGNCSIIANGATWNTGINTATAASTKTLTGTLTVSGLFIANMVGGGVFNGGTLILNGGLSTQQIQTGTTAITLGGGTWSGGQTISNPITIAGNITLGATVTALNTTVTYSSGTVTVTGSSATFRTCTLNTSGMTWNTVTFGPSNTCILTSDLNCNTLLFPGGNATVVNGAFNINCNNLTGGSAGTMAGTATIRMIGTGTWSMTGGTLANNLTFSSSGTITISGTVTYLTGTLTYTLGTVTTTGSTLTITASATLNTNGISWNTISFTGTTTITLSSNLTCSLLTCGNFPTINGNTVYLNSLTVNAVISGTSNVEFNGTGTWTGVTNYISNNININCTSLTITGSTVGYRTGTLTYTTGTVTTTGSTVVIGNSATLNTNGNSSGTGTTTSSTGINFNNLSISNNVAATITSNLCIVGTYLASTSGVGGTVNVTGPYSIYAQGDLTATSSALGTASIILNGTGTWSGSTFSMPVTINTTGTITLGTFNFSGVSLTYVAGSTICTGLISIGGTITLDTKGSDVPTCGTSSTSGINFNNLSIIQSLVITNNSNLRVTGTLISSISGYNGTWNGSNIYISGSLSATGAGTSGTALIILDGTGTLSGSTFSSNITINTAGTITIGSTFIFTGTTLTYISGKVNAKNSTVTLTNATLINCHKINFDTVIITSGFTVTMNEFFSGSPNLPVKVQASSAATNYTITFQNGFEKIAKYVKVSNLTLTNTAASRGSLLILNNKGKYFRGSNNIGNIRYTNSSPNGISKGTPTVPNSMTAPIGGYISDPIFN